MFYPSFVTLILAVAALGAPVIRDAAQVEADIDTMTAAAQSLYESINAFTNPNLTEALAIHMAALKLDSTLKQATAYADASPPFTDLQADMITQLVADAVPIIQNGLSELVKKKPAMNELHATGIAYEDLELLGADADGFGQAIFFRTPAGKQDALNKEIKAVQSYISAATEAYSSSN